MNVQERSVLTGTLNKLRIEMINIQGPNNREYYGERRLREMGLLRPLVSGSWILDPMSVKNGMFEY